MRRAPFAVELPNCTLGPASLTPLSAEELPGCETPEDEQVKSLQRSSLDVQKSRPAQPGKELSHVYKRGSERNLTCIKLP